MRDVSGHGGGSFGGQPSFSAPAEGSGATSSLTDRDNDLATAASGLSITAPNDMADEFKLNPRTIPTTSNLSSDAQQQTAPYTVQPEQEHDLDLEEEDPITAYCLIQDATVAPQPIEEAGNPQLVFQPTRADATPRFHGIEVVTHPIPSRWSMIPEEWRQSISGSSSLASLDSSSPGSTGSDSASSLSNSPAVDGVSLANIDAFLAHVRRQRELQPLLYTRGLQMPSLQQQTGTGSPMITHNGSREGYANVPLTPTRPPSERSLTHL